MMRSFAWTCLFAIVLAFAETGLSEASSRKVSSLRKLDNEFGNQGGGQFGEGGGDQPPASSPVNASPADSPVELPTDDIDGDSPADSPVDDSSPMDSPVDPPVEPPVGDPVENPTIDGGGGGIPTAPDDGLDVSSEAPTTPPVDAPTIGEGPTSNELPTEVETPAPTIFELPPQPAPHGNTFRPPTQSPTERYVPPEDDVLVDGDDNEPDDDNFWNNWSQGETLDEMEKDRNVLIALSTVAVVGLCCMLFTAQQMLENPDGCCAR